MLQRRQIEGIQECHRSLLLAMRCGDLTTAELTERLAEALAIIGDFCNECSGDEFVAGNTCRHCKSAPRDK